MLGSCARCWTGSVNGMRRRDAKLGALHRLIVREHPDRKVLVFSQFADTVRYLETQLSTRGLARMGAVTGDDTDPTKDGLAVQSQVP